MFRLKTVGALAVAGTLVLALAGCTGGGAGEPAQQESQIDLEAEEQAVRQINVRWLELYRAKDAAGIGALFVEDGWTLSGTNGLSEGRAAIVARNGEEFVNNPDASADWGAKQVWVAASGDLAIERGWWTEDEDGPGGEEAIEGEYITFFVKIYGEWKILADAATPVQGTGDED